MADEKTNTEGVIRAGKGAIEQFLGCVLLFLGLLNEMLALKSNLAGDWFNHIMMLSGAGLLGVGIWRSRR